MDDDARRVDALARPHGALDVVVYGARGIKSSSSLRILKLLCVVECAGARFKTRSKRTRGSPEWHASGRLTFRAPVRVDDEVVRVSVWDKRMGGHKCMGSATASLRDVVAGTYANGKNGPTPWNLALEGCKYPGASVQVNLRMVGGDATPRGDEPGDAAAATTDGEEDVSFDAEERASGGGEEEMIVRTVMTPLKETREDVEDTSEENAEGSEENAEQEDEEDEESDEWAAALRPSSPVPSTGDAVEPEMEMNKKKKVPEPRELASKFADIWAEDSMDDVVVVSVSEFGRTITSNGAGTDHGWGGNHFVLGGSVRGGQVLGTYPDDLTDAGALNTGRGRIIPTTPWEAIWQALAQWLGVTDADTIAELLPNRGNFPSERLLSKDQVFVA